MNVCGTLLTIVALLAATPALADFHCVDDTVSYDTPTAIFTNGNINVTNCTLVNISLWCDDCTHMLVRSSTFPDSPCPVIGYISSKPISVDNVDGQCHGSPKRISVRHAMDSCSHNSLKTFIDASAYIFFTAQVNRDFVFTAQVNRDVVSTRDSGIIASKTAQFEDYQLESEKE
jgi:hypothetical protein